MQSLRINIVVVYALCVFSIFGSAYGREPLKVAAAADLKFALDEVIKLFKGHDVQALYGSSGNLAAQFMNGAPYDIFLSADSSYSNALIQKGLASQEDQFNYAVGKMGLWMKSSKSLDLEKLGLSVLLDPSVRKIAIANPQHAPYGRAAEAALRKAGIYEKVKDKLVFGENVGQAAQFVQSGSADIGILAMGLISAPQLQKAGKFWVFPDSSYPRMDQFGVILKGTKDRKEADEFRNFLLGREAQDIFKHYGFATPNSQSK